MAKILTIALASSFLMITDEAAAQSHNLCMPSSTCIERKECFSLLQERNSSTETFFFSCHDDDPNWICCPLLSDAREPKTSPMDNLMLLPQYCGLSSENRIFGGQEAFIGQFPWMVLIAYRTNGSGDAVEYLCGGTLINNRYVLTAAHCLQNGVPVSVRLGELDISQETDCEEDYCADPPVDVELEKIVSHQDYNKPLLKNDIALLRLKANVSTTTYISPICLPFGINITGEERNKTYLVAGWGRVQENHHNGSNTLQFTRVANVPVSLCTRTQPKGVRPIGELQLCAATRRRNDVCKGDSGGPLMETKMDNQGSIRTYQMGIVSFGFGSCGRDIPSVYTRVTAYLNWILSNLEP